MKVQSIVNGIFDTNCYLVVEKDECILIDAPAPAASIIDILDRFKLKLTWIYLTHGHFDHVLALRELKEHYPVAKIAISRADKNYLEKGGERCRLQLSTFGTSLLRYFKDEDFDFPPIDRYLEDGDELEFGFYAMKTSGHTDGSMCFINDKERVIFSGDTLFRGSVGRTDLGGSEEEILLSLEKIKNLEGDYTVFPGHDRNTTLSYERRNNPYMLFN